MSTRKFPKAMAPIALVGVLLLSACASAVPAGDSSPPTPTAALESLDGSSWILDTMGKQPVNDDTTVTLQFGTDGTLGGSSGCNQYFGDFSVTGDQLTVEPLGTTLMACEQPVLEQEAAFVAMLQDSTSFSVADDQLTLMDSAGAAHLMFVAQSEVLAGSAWIVTSYNNGAQAVVSVLEATDANLSFDEDGTFSGTGGCNQFSGEYVVEDRVIRIAEVAFTEMGCDQPAGVMEQEAAVVAALESANEYSVEGSELRLTTADGQTAMTLFRG